jgi:ParB family transcriptional regulator, chromosome partitioning protein
MEERTIMQDKKRVLGRGLESLIPATRSYVPAAHTPPTNPAPVLEEFSGERVQEIRLEEIEPSPYQPRRHQDEAALEELAQSIRVQGVLQPIVVRAVSVDGRRSMVDGQSPETNAAFQADAGAFAVEVDRAPQTHIKYQLIAGERRWLASKRAGRETVPAIVRVVSNEQAMEIALIENLQREDLDCMEMAIAFERLGREFALTQDEMARRTGRDRTTISNLLRLLKLPDVVKVALTQHELSFSHAKELLSLEDPTVITAAAQRIIRQGLSVKQTQELVNHLVWLGPNEDKPKKRVVIEDPNVRAARIELEGRLGCRVKIMDKNGKGKVIIEYKGLDDFDRIVDALAR